MQGSDMANIDRTKAIFDPDSENCKICVFFPSVEAEKSFYVTFSQQQETNLSFQGYTGLRCDQY